ncbi:MAG: ABC transporter ATP-binding protein [Methanotrichaceae archaeon]|nr:ABC transporter ATP-binding protein [Methanotrichaceae archaeon]
MAIEVEHLSKDFRIPHERRTTLFENLVGFLRPSEYETIPVLHDLNFSVDDGECLGIIGENGSGKSTLLKIIANILPPSRGRVVVEGKLTPFLELGVGFHHDFSVRENIGIYATIMGLSNGAIRERMDEIIRFAGLEKFQDTKLKNLSSGMQVRLAFSTAVQTDPEILLIDEVLAVGDMEFQQKCFQVFERYRKEGVTMLFVSHDLGSVRRFCDKTLLLKHGEQVAFGETGDIIDQYVYGGGAQVEIVSEESEPPSVRWGDGSVVITGVTFLDKFGSEGGRFNSFDSLNVRIHYRAREVVHDPVFGIALYSEAGQHLYGTNTDLKGVDIPLVEGEGHLDLQVDRLPLLSGRFLLTVAVHARDGKPYDWIDKQYSFEVLPFGRDAGIIDFPCRWIM